MYCLWPFVTTMIMMTTTLFIAIYQCCCQPRCHSCRKMFCWRVIKINRAKVIFQHLFFFACLLLSVCRCQGVENSFSPHISLLCCSFSMIWKEQDKFNATYLCCVVLRKFAFQCELLLWKNWRLHDDRGEKNVWQEMGSVKKKREGEQDTLYYAN